MPRVRLTRDHLSAIGALTADGRVLMQVQTEAVRGPQVVRFLRRLLRHIPGKLLAIREGAPIHYAEAVNAFLAGSVAGVCAGPEPGGGPLAVSEAGATGKYLLSHAQGGAICGARGDG